MQADNYKKLILTDLEQKKKDSLYSVKLWYFHFINVN